MLGIRANQTAHLVPVHPRHQDVEKHDVGLVGGHALKALLPGCGSQHVITARGKDGIKEPKVLWRIVDG